MKSVGPRTFSVAALATILVAVLFYNAYWVGRPPVYEKVPATEQIAVQMDATDSPTRLESVPETPAARKEAARLQPSLKPASVGIGEEFLRVENCEKAGRATPQAALETAFWAAYAGDDDELAACFTTDDAGQAVVDDFWDQLPDDLKATFPSPQHLVALAFSYEMLRGAESVRIVKLQVFNEHTVDVSSQVQRGSRIGTGKIRLKRDEEEWRINIPGAMMGNLWERLQHIQPTVSNFRWLQSSVEGA
jgi:hypothetical protein